MGNGLSVIVPSVQKGITQYEWQMKKKGTSWKAQMKSDMDAAIRGAHSYEDFICWMQSKGYAVKGDTFGEGYSKEAIKERIEKRVKTQNYSAVRKGVPFPKKPDSLRILIDTDKEKF